MIFAGALMSCKPIREPVVEFFTNVYEKFTEFFFGDEDKDAASKVITKIHTLSYVPEGYELVESPILTNKDKELYTVWQNNDGYKIFFFQSTFINKTTFDTENAEALTLSNGSKILIIRKSDQIFVYWNDIEYSYTLMIYDQNNEEIIKIIDSFV